MKFWDYMVGILAPDSSGGGSGADPPEEELAQEKRWLREAEEDPEKFSHFFDKYLDRIFRFIFWKTLDHDLSKDLTSDTFLRAFQKREQFQWQGHRFGAWLHRIALNLVRAHYGRETGRGVSGKEDTDYLASALPSPLAELILKEEQKLLFGFVATLDELSQDIFLLRHAGQLKIREIAEMLELPEGTVKARLSRTVKKIKKMRAKHDKVWLRIRR